MSTDNREQLFPDVIEHYAPDVDVDCSAGEDFPDFTIPEETYSPVTPEIPAEQVIPVVQVDLEPVAVAPVVVDIEPIDTAPAVVDLEPFDTVDSDDDPLAHAPEWARAHLPRHPLTLPVRQKRGLSSALSKRPRSPKPAPLTADTTPAPIVDVVAPQPEPAAAAPTSQSRWKNPWLAGGVGAAVLAVVAGASVVALSDSPDPVAVPPLPTSTSVAKTTTAVAAAATWCEDGLDGDRIIGRGPGNPATGPGLIQAFDHAYYVEHDGAKVASMMTSANAASIQKSIDALPAGTEHCLTIAPTPDPNVFGVDLTLRTSEDTAGTIPQRFTLAPTPNGLKIAKIEETR